MPKATSKHITKRARISKAERLIYDHLNALRVLRRLKKTLDQLCKKHPGLEERRPLLLIHTYKDGRKVYGRWTDKYDRVFIPALQPNEKEREEFLEKARAALPAHTKKRIAAGVEAAADRLLHAGCDEVSAFHKIITHAPRTAKEAGLIARHVIKHLPIKAGGTVFGNGRDDYEKWKVRRHCAFFTVETVLRTFAKAAH